MRLECNFSVEKYKVKSVSSALILCEHFESATIYISMLMLAVCVCVRVCVCVCESVAGAGEGGVVGVCLDSQQGEELEQLVLHLAKLRHWL